MFFLNDAHTHAVIAFVATGHVLFMDTASRTPVACVDVGVQAHAAVPAPDQSYVIVANQNGKLLQRINTNYATGTFTLDPAATIDLAACTTPSGAPCQDATLRPDNAPICTIIDSDSDLAFVTLRGGGLFVVDSTATPMSIVAEYDKATVHPNGCGGAEARGKMYINSGGGTAGNPLEADLYMFPLSGFSTTPNPPNTPAPTVVFSHDDRNGDGIQDFVDSHGATLTKHSRYLWVGDRAANRIVVVDTRTDAVVNEINLAGELTSDPAPDLMDISPSGNRVFIALRGPNPLTGNAPGVNNAVGNTPGVGVMRVNQGGRNGVLQAIASITHPDAMGIERADPHGLRVRLISGHGDAANSGTRIAAQVVLRPGQAVNTQPLPHSRPAAQPIAGAERFASVASSRKPLPHAAEQRLDATVVDSVLASSTKRSRHTTGAAAEVMRLPNSVFDQLDPNSL